MRRLRRPTGFPANTASEKILRFGVNPNSAFQIASIDRNNGMGMTPWSGSVRWGSSASMMTRPAGDLGPLQDFRGGAFVGKSADNIRYRPNIAFPSTAGPAPAMSPVTSLLARIAENRVN